MIQAKTPIVNNQQTIKSVKYYTVANKIIPIRRVSFDMIPRLEEPVNTEIELTKKDIKRVVVEKKRNNPLNKFFKKALQYIDKLEDFIDTMKSLKLKTIVQKKILLETDKSDQKIRQYRAKRIVKETKQAEDQQQQQEVDLKDVGDKLALALGLGALATGSTPSGAPGGTEIYDDVVGQGEFGVQQGQNVSRPPAWIPFPKGTAGLVYTSGYGMRVSPTSGRYKMHSGIDIAGPTGAPIITPITGVVSFAGDEGDGYGFKVVITSGQLKMLFGHLHKQPSVTTNQQVRAGTVIGGMGSTGQSTGPHLHWNVYVNGSTVNPIDWTYSNRPQTGTTNFKVRNERPPLDNESEGGINTNKRILVGEAGTEFVVPLSQMPLFMQSMMEEKIKCLNPFYTPQKVFGDIGIKPSFGKTNKKYSAGAVVINYSNPNYSIAAKKLKSSFPSAKNYHIAAALGNFEMEAPGLKPNTYQFGGGPGRGIAQWEIDHKDNNFNGRWTTAVKKYGPGVINSLGQQLDFVKWEMDTAHIINGNPNLPWGRAAKREWLNTKDVISATENFMLGYEAPGTPHWEKRRAAAINLNKNMNKLLGMTTKKDDEPKTKPKSKPKERSWFDKFIKALTTSPDGNPIITPDNKRSLNDIDQSNQMEVAKAYQNQFELNTDNVNQIIPLQIRVHYSETV
jgi:murein DD-endopeptidase MepM/ murein hydrolase activator NlpD